VRPGRVAGTASPMRPGAGTSADDLHARASNLVSDGMVGRLRPACSAARWVAATATAIASAAACGGGSGDGGTGVQSCQVTGPTGSGADAGNVLAICLEMQDATPQQLQNQCMAYGTGAMGALLNVPCPHAGALGGCKINLGGATGTVWYYQSTGGSTDDIRMLCQVARATFVAP
jgi:hypothetical protein